MSARKRKRKRKRKTKTMKTNIDHDRMSDAGPRSEAAAEVAPILVDKNYVVIEGNCRMACVRLIAEEMKKARGRRSGRGTARGRGVAAGPAPPPGLGV